MSSNVRTRVRRHRPVNGSLETPFESSRPAADISVARALPVSHDSGHQFGGVNVLPVAQAQPSPAFSAADQLTEVSGSDSSAEGLEGHETAAPTLRTGATWIQRDAVDPPPPDANTPPDQGQPLSGGAASGSTTISLKEATRVISASNLTALWANMTNSGTRESASVLPALTPPPQYEYDGNDKVKKVVITVIETKEMPQWQEADAQCAPIKNEWKRFYGVLDAHENRHLAIDKKHFDNLHLKLVGKPRETAWKIADDAVTAADTENQTYDTQSQNGVKEGANINTAVQCAPEKVNATSIPPPIAPAEDQGTPPAPPSAVPEPVVQAKLTVSEPGDPMEDEADAMADRVMQMGAVTGTRGAAIQRVAHCAGGDVCECGKCQRKASGDAHEVDIDAGVGTVVARGGRGLGEETRAFMEPRFGHDFSQVRVHTDAQAAESARAMRARAYTVGRDIVFANGAYDPRSADGQRLLAHELTHVVQQEHAPRLSDESAVAADASPSLTSSALTVAREPDAPTAPAAPPVAAPGTPATAEPGNSGFSLKKFLTGDQKVNLNLGNHSLFSKRAGKNFSWSTEAGKGPKEDVAVPLGVIPIPPPVGPIVVLVEGSASAYAGGSASIDVDLTRVILELSALDAAKLQGLSLLALTGAGLIPALGLLQQVNLHGKANLEAKATAKLMAGAQASLALAANSIWPVKGFVNAALGITGDIEAIASFEAKEIPFVLDFVGPVPRFRVLNLSVPARAATSIKTHLGLSGSLGIGVEIGYAPASVRRELLRASYNPRFDIGLEHAIGGGSPATLTTGGDGNPEIDLPKIVFTLKSLLSSLIENTARNDNAQPQPATGRSPVGSADDPVLIYWCKPDRIYKNPIEVDDAETPPNEKVKYYRDSPQLLDRAEGYTIGVTYWPKAGDTFTKRKGTKRSEQARFIKILEDHHFEFGKSDLWKFSPDHVHDIGLAGDAADRTNNLWPAERTANEAAGSHHANQSVWFREGEAEPQNPTALVNVPDGKVLKIREVVQAPPGRPPRADGTP
jgi:hypothetical protein